eukprot:1156540-Pelagomonas_calceolata.AAC.3
MLVVQSQLFKLAKGMLSITSPTNTQESGMKSQRFRADKLAEEKDIDGRLLLIFTWIDIALGIFLFDVGWGRTPQTQQLARHRRRKRKQKGKKADKKKAGSEPQAEN